MATPSIKHMRLPLGVIAVGFVSIGFSYVTVQQSYRQNAWDPQIQMAEDAAVALNAGADPKALVANTKVDLSSSLAPFVIVTNDNLDVVASSGQLDGQTVLPPTGSFTAAKEGQGKGTTQSHENRISWQPATGVRDAAVIVHYSHGYVLAARSLREAEARVTNLTELGAAALVGVIIIGIFLFLL